MKPSKLLRHNPWPSANDILFKETVKKNIDTVKIKARKILPKKVTFNTDTWAINYIKKIPIDMSLNTTPV